MAQGKKEEAEAVKAEVAQISKRLTELEPLEKEYQDKVLEDMMKIPNIIDPSVPIGKDDTFNVENEKFGEPVVPDFEIPYHTDIMERFDGIDLDASRKGCRKRFLLSDGRYRTSSLSHDSICA